MTAHRGKVKREPMTLREAERILKQDHEINTLRWKVIFCAGAAVDADERANACKPQFEQMRKAVKQYRRAVLKSECGKVIL
jgi:hypothetical protein